MHSHSSKVIYTYYNQGGKKHLLHLQQVKDMTLFFQENVLCHVNIQKRFGVKVLKRF